MPDLAGKRFLVAGGAGVAGECVTVALLRAGARVVVPSRTPDRIERLRGGVRPELLPHLHTLVGDVGDPAAVDELRDRIAAEFGPLDGAVASLGGWWEGSVLTEVPSATWERILRDNLTAHFLVARTFLADLARRGNPGCEPVYIALAGIAALQPVPYSGPISVTGAAQTMLLRTLRAELRHRPVRLHEVAILTPVVTRHWPPHEPAEDGWLSGDQVGEYVASVASEDFPHKDRLQVHIPDGRDDRDGPSSCS